MLGTEIFTVNRLAKVDSLFNVGWAFPNAYEVGMTSLGFQLVWWLLEQDAEIQVKRIFTDCQETGWTDSELVGFTLSWELDYVNVIRLLKQLGIPASSKDRQAGSPLVFGGGPALSANPEPFADFFDVVLLGDAEAIVPAFIETWKRVRHLSDRRLQLIELSKIDGIYVPSLYRYKLTGDGKAIDSIEPAEDNVPTRLTRRVFTPPPDYVAHSLMLAPDTTWGDMFLVEVARSCPQECRFCLASYLSRPFRAARVETIMEKIDIGLKHTKKIGLLGPSVTEHPQFDQLAHELLRRPQTEISIASVRADSLNPLILEMLHKLGHKTVTIAIESGSERLRTIMKKNLTEEQIEHAVDLIEKSGMSGLKFYGIVGLPGESAEDLEETVRLLLKLKKAHKRLRFVFGCSSFVPKAQTPFQWSGRDRQSAAKLEYLRKHVCKAGIAMRPESHNWSDVQALLSRGDRRLAPMLLSVAEGKGNLGAWRAALRNRPEGCPDEDFYVFRNIPYDETLPWSHLVDEPKAAMLVRHSETAEKLSIGKPDG
jgi:radical SAM superfamily enzyme YgiQ (UPF0313 family)